VEFERTFVVEEAPRDRARSTSAWSGYPIWPSAFSSISAAAALTRLGISMFCVWSLSSSTVSTTPGKLNGFDKIVYYASVGAGLFAPTIFCIFA